MVKKVLIEQLNETQTRRLKLARNLVNISKEAAEIQHLVERIPEIMCTNDQLRPLWERWEKAGMDAKSPYKSFSRQEIAILKAFLEYISYASDRFISQIHQGK
ncbi:hypothetical protein [Anabaena azotica]|uniref:Uncharacterized protein n=1 Tax=Anabaena azotica FACHB-119 TaxID=947527 RepID=A0ABR8DCI9_9NOST|nr:hypothetical protein [Anabaena azotica]MBD2504917.1 hypothetical protein [Anabaena azotica FACHB-119]